MSNSKMRHTLRASLASVTAQGQAVKQGVKPTDGVAASICCAAREPSACKIARVCLRDCPIPATERVSVSVMANTRWTDGVAA